MHAQTTRSHAEVCDTFIDMWKSDQTWHSLFNFAYAPGPDKLPHCVVSFSPNDVIVIPEVHDIFDETVEVCGKKTLPFSPLCRAFVGGHFGEYLPALPETADFAAQVAPTVRYQKDVHDGCYSTMNRLPPDALSRTRISSSRNTSPSSSGPSA
jgi:hypothetical protein